ncbi:LOW QUALITY PROTEIN: hypothetical protein M514_25393 [Trichuris suis]|uniref:ISXO2-like transposase domain-containing protein n=1 Tax=Trichuris suis TaxID=68888 RepID=A0A085MYT9_9BILA|nr:LOW QUALITY PROTEIN: hypothetical protein M514_25393 [Trichuris suis]
MQLGRGRKVWCCYKRSCRVEVSIRTWTWFEGSSVTSINKNVTSRCNRHMKKVAAEALAELPVQLASPSQTMELDETLFCRSKYNKGRQYAPHHVWGTCRKTGHCFVAPVKNWSSGTVLLIVKRDVRPGTTVITDVRFLAREGSLMCMCTTPAPSRTAQAGLTRNPSNHCGPMLNVETSSAVAPIGPRCRCTSANSCGGRGWRRAATLSKSSSKT